MKLYRSIFFIVVVILGNLSDAVSQAPYGLEEAFFNKHCSNCREIIFAKPDEVLFGIDIQMNGDIYFSTNNREWFNKIIKSDAYGISVDLVDMERYNCRKKIIEKDNDAWAPKGTMMMPVYRKQLLQNEMNLSSGHIYTKIGVLPSTLKGKTLEANLVILNGRYICYYTNFLNIDRSVWDLLPMGLFTDSVTRFNTIHEEKNTDGFTYDQQMQMVIPFEKGTAIFTESMLQPLLDSVHLPDYRIRFAEIRAYSSVEGKSSVNKALMQKRADAVVAAIEKSNEVKATYKVLTAENWVEFLQDIQGTRFSNLLQLSKAGIKQKLTDAILAKEAEPILAKHRKVIITFYLNAKKPSQQMVDEAILSNFKKALDDKDFSKAREIQQELFERIRDNRLPNDYIGKVEVPMELAYADILNDREVYRYLLRATSEYEALYHFLSLQKLDPSNGKISYNICSLRFFLWKNGEDTLASGILKRDIATLEKKGIHKDLVRRMQIKYQILMCDRYMNQYEYEKKDTALEMIRDIYQQLTLTDREIYSLAKYFSYYSRGDWAKEMIEPRVNSIKVNENLLFYYINLLFYEADFESEVFTGAVANAINLNRERFCNFFRPNHAGGAGMQLLDYEELRKVYCEECASQ